MEDGEESEAMEPSEQNVDGCPFAPRCRYGSDLCRQEYPQLEDTADGEGSPHLVACHHKHEIELKGV
jgi:ABC-type dipeptide/oligopeptide/nickel transport system ATPase component